MLARERVESNGVALEQTEKSKSQTASAPWRSRHHQRSGRLKPWQKASIVICLGLAWLSAGQASQAAADPKAKEAVDHVAALFSSKATTATVDMQITKQDGKRTILMQFWCARAVGHPRTRSQPIGGRRLGHPEGRLQDLVLPAEGKAHGRDADIDDDDLVDGRSLHSR